jgi:hypothetical protein
MRNTVPRTALPLTARGGGGASRRLSPILLLLREGAVVLLSLGALFVAGGLA